MGKKHFCFFQTAGMGTEPRTLAWTAAVLTTTLGPRPKWARRNLTILCKLPLGNLILFVIQFTIDGVICRILYLNVWRLISNRVPICLLIWIYCSYYSRHFLSYTFNHFMKWEKKFRAGTVSVRQNLTSVDIRFWRIKTIPALKGLQYL